MARTLAGTGLPHALLVELCRAAVAAGEDAEGAAARAGRTRRRLLQPVVNATGVLLHTNLGRAPLAVPETAGPLNLEIDLDTGRRGARAPSVAELLRILTGAEDALVVNNGAAAVLLALTALGDGAPVIVSRGELVEIGGGFRVPEVIAAAGTTLVEVGTTNRTRLDDYRAALEGTTGTPVVLKVHQSNYRIVGFTTAVTVAELAQLGAPVVADLGSGLLDADTPWIGRPPAWLAGEPAARQTLADGAALVTFSGDKLLGGPQAGIVAGAAGLVARCARHPLARALRPGGLVLAALEQTLLAYVRREARAVPLWRMVLADPAELRERAGAVARAVGPAAEVVACAAVAGGGSLPGVELPSFGVSVAGDQAGILRRHVPPVIATVRDGQTLCNLRTVEPEDDAVLVSALKDR